MSTFWRHRRRVACCAAVAGALLTVPAVSASAAVHPVLGEAVATAAQAECAPIVFYANRGSSENLNARADRADGRMEADGTTGLTKYFEGLGQVLAPIYLQMRGDLAAGRIVAVANRAPQTSTEPGPFDPLGDPQVGYRAIGYKLTKLGSFTTYRRSVDEGVAAAVRDLTLIHDRCPATTLVVAGYSEGAEVARRALAALPWTPAPGKAYAMIFGDPLWKSREPGVHHVGDSARDQKGAFRTAREGDLGIAAPSVMKALEPPIPGWAAGWDVTSWCHGGDGACQWRPGALIAHLTYGEADAVGAAARMATTLGGPYARPVVSARITSAGQCYPTGKRLRIVVSMVGATPDSPPVTVRTQWEPTPWSPTGPITVSPAAPVVTKSFPSGLFPRLVVWLGDHKLDYRNVC